MRGTRKHPLPSIGSKSNNKPKHYTKLLAANSMTLGWLNGERLHKKGA